MASQTILVYEALKNDIRNGKYSPSESLKEIDLANIYKVSRNTVKKSLLMLEKEGFVVTELNKGAKVRSFSLDEVLNFLELRSVLEAYITELAVPLLTGQDILKLENHVIQMKIHFENNALVDYSKCNLKFHGIIHSACSNSLAVEMTTSLKNQMSKYNTKTILIPGRSQASLGEHLAILEAIKARDAKLAGQRMQQHILNVQKTFKENYVLLI